jgi:hypothetical protein
VHRIVTAGLLVGPAAYSVHAERPLVMVALATPRFGFIPEINLARQFLLRAQLAEEAGNVTEAGVYLREAVRRQLVAMCHWYDCWPKDLNQQRANRFLVKLLRKAKAIDDGGAEWFHEMIDVGNAAAHCNHVDRRTLRGVIGFLHCIIDSDPCGEVKERVDHPEPVNEFDADDCDDDDSADWWKNGGAI